jgi:hypothetical protein
LGHMKDAAALNRMAQAASIGRVGVKEAETWFDAFQKSPSWALRSVEAHGIIIRKSGAGLDVVRVYDWTEEEGSSQMRALGKLLSSLQDGRPWRNWPMMPLSGSKETNCGQVVLIRAFLAGVVVEVPRYMPISVCASSARRPKAIESASKAGMRRITQRERRVTDGWTCLGNSRKRGSFPSPLAGPSGLLTRRGAMEGEPMDLNIRPATSRLQVKISRVGQV